MKYCVDWVRINTSILLSTSLVYLADSGVRQVMSLESVSVGFEDFNFEKKMKLGS